MTPTPMAEYPWVGASRELKRQSRPAVRGGLERGAIETTGAELRRRHWASQRKAGLGWVRVDDFAFYEQVLAYSVILGAMTMLQ